MQQTATLNQEEIYQAIFEYASKEVNFEGKSHKIDVVAGRGEKGLYAIITLEPHKEILTDTYSQVIQDLQDGNLDLEDEGVPVEIEDNDIDPDTQVFE